MNIIALPQFLFCENRMDMPGAGIIIETLPPYFIGRVVVYKDYNTMALAIVQKDKNFLAYASQVTGYNIAIQFAGTMKGNKVSAEPGILNKIQRTMQMMAAFYLAEKIEPKKSYYAKHLAAPAS